MPLVEIAAAGEDDRLWAATLMASSEPWITLGRGFDRCLLYCRDPEYLIFVARQDDKPQGAIILQPRGVAGSPYIVSLVVAPEARGAGIGGRLLAFAEALMSERSAHLFLCVSSFNVRARRFYEHHSYAVIADLDDYVIAGASELLMHKRLTPA